jgi:hypothetical protein
MSFERKQQFFAFRCVATGKNGQATREVMGLRRMYYLLLAICMLSTMSGTRVMAQEPDVKEQGKAAFIRDGKLWVKAGAEERMLSSYDGAANPLWSSDGQWLAYTVEASERQLRIAHLESGREELLSEDAAIYRWANHRPELAYTTSGGQLNRIPLDKPFTKPSAILEGVGQFTWLPNDEGLLVGSRVTRSEEGIWTPLMLSKVTVLSDATPTVQPFFQLPEESEHMLIVGLTEPRWSKDGKWIAFIATPTASWSMDSNWVCVLSASGDRFRILGQMLARSDWYQWAPKQSDLGYIEGEGRFEVSNKHMTVEEMFSAPGRSYTPRGLMDIGFTWINDKHIVVSRSPELGWEEGPVPQAEPALYRIHLVNRKQERITAPPEGSGDFYPRYIDNDKRLSWVRKDTASGRSDVWLAKDDGEGAERLIRNIEGAPVWYEAQYTHRNAEAMAKASEPQYAKWGRLAMEEVSRKYRENIVDYLHLGRTYFQDDEAEEAFKLWLRSAEREFGVLVKIRFHTVTEQVISIQLFETNR